MTEALQIMRLNHELNDDIKKGLDFIFSIKCDLAFYLFLARE